LFEYSAQINIDTLMVKPGGENNATLADLADLRGSRFVTTSEAEEGQRLRVGKLKYISAGMGAIKSMRKYENPIEFQATHKLFLDANHRPVVPASDEAIWNRLKPVPFLVTIPPEEIDLLLLEKLKAESSGVLAWAVRGCRAWLAEGLGDPPEIGGESSSWRSNSDPLKDFLEDCCQLDPEAWCRVSDVARAYERWAHDFGEKYPLNRQKFNDQLEQRGCRRIKRSIEGATGVRIWVGIYLQPGALPQF
jgi:putative DNA primase/helicase